ncbi:DUF3800 domain-containing protein [Microcella daejeonensis]|uniref:DUF3800 domain-containing protein n=1 Tax=Microcella daejeonensis TaxID=2994971 RepID=UPI00226EE42E|nr:DUF3800 domain-containing protein [Microcella daejeonensis]WAB84079.1 DUF3800 domain-containing protein [Microcella daejeonensis]
MYLLFVDESGTHPGPHPFVLGGIAVHEDDAVTLQKTIDSIVVKHLGRIPPNLDEYELHASEMRNAKKPKVDNGQKVSIWANVPRSVRLAILDDAYDEIANFTTLKHELPTVLFGVAVEKDFHSDWSPIERERWAYEVLLGKFDVMLKTLRNNRNLPNRGLVIHDRRVVAERDIQTWTAQWRVTAERIGQLRNLADVPLFSDSRATRLLQLADIVSYAVFRNYNQQSPSDREFQKIWQGFHSENSVTHGCVHFTPSYGQGACSCAPCSERLLAESSKKHVKLRQAR